MTTPTAFHDAAALALACVCEQMEVVAAEIPEYPGCPCRQYVSAGEPAMDNCCEDCGDNPTNHGQLTVQIEDVFPSESFPSAAQLIHPCAPAVWVAHIKVLVARCAPSQDEQGNPPSNEELSANAELLATDLYAILQGLTCCLTAEPVGAKTKRRVSIAATGTATVPTEGGCAAIEVRAYVEVGNVCRCSPEGS